MSSVMQPRPPVLPGLPAAWRVAAPVYLLLLLALLLLYRETGLAMVGIWERSETFAHAFIVPPITLWLIWRQRGALALLSPRPNPWFALPLALAALAWLLGDLVAVNALTQLSLVAMIVLSVPLLLGWLVARQIAFPLGFLFFCVPIGEFMMPTLMAHTADFTVAALRLSGVPVYREGLQFVIPSGSWSVVEACSGLRYLIASVMVGTLFAYLNYRSLRRRWIFIAVAALLPLVANWVRAYLIVMLGHLSSNKLAAGADHLIYGWVFFGIIMLVMFMIGARWAEAEAPLSVAVAGESTTAPRRPFWQVPVLTLALLLAPHLALHALESDSSGSRDPVLDGPALPGWTRLDPAMSDWKPVFTNPATELQTAYARSGREVGLYLAYYRQQGYDRKLINSQNQLVTSENKQWARFAGASPSVPLAGQEVAVRGAEVRSSTALGLADRRLLVWQFYWVDGRLTASDVRAKAYGAWQRLLGRGDDAAAVIVYTRLDPENGALAEQALKDFLQDGWPAIESQLQRTRGAAH
jgi:exosortase A